MNQPRLVVTYRKLSELKPYANNPRINDGAIDAVIASIQAFGVLNPMVIDANDEIVAGHTRYYAAQKMGMETFPTVDAADLTPDQVKYFRLVDNKTSELSIWDVPLLHEELNELGDSFDMSQFGFELSMDGVLGDQSTPTSRELNQSDYDDEQFECTCPECGFRFNAP